MCIAELSDDGAGVWCTLWSPLRSLFDGGEMVTVSQVVVDELVFERSSLIPSIFARAASMSEILVKSSTLMTVVFVVVEVLTAAVALGIVVDGGGRFGEVVFLSVCGGVSGRFDSTVARGLDDW